MHATFYSPQPEIIFLLLASKFSFTPRRQFWLPCDFIALPYIVSIDFVVHLNLASVLLKSFPRRCHGNFSFDDAIDCYIPSLKNSSTYHYHILLLLMHARFAEKSFLQDNIFFTLSCGLTWEPCFNSREFWLAHAWFIQAVQLFQINDWHHILTVFIG